MPKDVEASKDPTVPQLIPIPGYALGHASPRLALPFLKDMASERRIAQSRTQLRKSRNFVFALHSFRAQKTTLSIYPLVRT